MPQNSNNEVKYAVNDLKEIVDIFLSKTKDNGRYLSYEYCFDYFNKHYKNTDNEMTTDDETLNQMTIYLYTYLASWGMLRNSFLLYKDPFFNRGIVELLCKTKIELETKIKSETNITPTDILKLKQDIINTYKYKDINKKDEKGNIIEIDNRNTYFKEEEEHIINNPTDTLVSKIILGTLGILPAYDKFFITTASNLNIKPKINEKSISQLQQFAKDNENIIEEIKLTTENYTTMKIVDMYFWQKAYNLSALNRIKNCITELNKTSNKEKKNKYNDTIKNLINSLNKADNLKELKQNWYNELNPLLSNFNTNEIKEKCDQLIREYYLNSIVNLLPYNTDTDFKFVFNTKKNAYKDYVVANYGKWDNKDQQNRFNDYIKDNLKNIKIISYLGEKIGFIDYVINNNSVDIGNICINKQFRNKGIGSYLLRKLINDNPNKNISLQVFKQNTSAIRLYEKLKFKIFETTKTHHKMQRIPQY